MKQTSFCGLTKRDGHAGESEAIVVLNGEGVAFQGCHSPLSNWYPCNSSHCGGIFVGE